MVSLALYTAAEFHCFEFLQAVARRILAMPLGMTPFESSVDAVEAINDIVFSALPAEWFMLLEKAHAALEGVDCHCCCVPGTQQHLVLHLGLATVNPCNKGQSTNTLHVDNLSRRWCRSCRSRCSPPCRQCR